MSETPVNERILAHCGTVRYPTQGPAKPRTPVRIRTPPPESRSPDLVGVPDSAVCHRWPAVDVVGTTANSTSTKDFDEKYPRIDRGRKEGQHGAGKDPVQPTT
jgi:hypothetical protein